MTLADFAWAHAEQTRIFRALPGDFPRLRPGAGADDAGVTPFPWTQLYLDEMDGKKLRNYYHWLALTYFDHAGHQPGDLAALRPRPRGMPFGLQVIGRFRGDGEVLGAAHAMEQAFKRIPGLARRCPTRPPAQADARAEVDRHPSARSSTPDRRAAPQAGQTAV